MARIPVSTNILGNIDLPSLPEAACKDLDPSPWFADSRYKRNATPEQQKAINICFTCLEREKCLTYALDNQEDFWIWGGTTPSERMRIKNRRRKR